jgi:hypothetical protein
MWGADAQVASDHHCVSTLVTFSLPLHPAAIAPVAAFNDRLHCPHFFLPETP